MPANGRRREWKVNSFHVDVLNRLLQAPANEKGISGRFELAFVDSTTVNSVFIK